MAYKLNIVVKSPLMFILLDHAFESYKWIFLCFHHSLSKMAIIREHSFFFYFLKPNQNKIFQSK